jgi:hypothetical protein
MKEDTYRLLNRLYKIFTIPTIVFVIISFFDKRFDLIWIPLYIFTILCGYIAIIHFERDSKGVWFWRFALIISLLLVLLYVLVDYTGVI